MKKIFLIVLIPIIIGITFVLYEYIVFKEVLLPGFAYYSRCADDASCMRKEQPTNLRELYDTYCCDTERIVSCGNENSRLIADSGKVCNYICIGKHYKEGGVRLDDNYCD